MYFTLELSKKKIASKFDNCLFGRTLDKIKNAPKEFAHALVEMRDKLTGKLYICEFPTKGITVDRMGALIERIGGVDLVIVDYAQLIKSSGHRDDRKQENTDVYEGLRRIAGELQVPIWTAHQSNRPGTDSKVIRMEHIAEDFNVAAIADICLSFNHNEEEDRANKARFFIMKSRIGMSGVQLDVSVNFKTARVTQI